VSLPLSTTDFSTVALSIKSAGCDMVGGQLTSSQDVGLIQAMNNLGVKLKASYFSGGYAQSLLQDPSTRAAVQGYGFGVQYEPLTLNTPATKQLQSALAKYADDNDPNPRQALPGAGSRPSSPSRASRSPASTPPSPSTSASSAR
jgi:branched-chain amino acid transport system substrate-binding protein